MKKLISLILALITLTALCIPALADGGDYSMLGDWTGEVISRQVSLYNQANSSSGSSR